MAKRKKKRNFTPEAFQKYAFSTTHEIGSPLWVEQVNHYGGHKKTPKRLCKICIEKRIEKRIKKHKRKNPYLYPGSISFMDPWQAPTVPAAAGYPPGVTANQFKAGTDGLVRNPMAKRKKRRRNSGYEGRLFDGFDPRFDMQLRNRGRARNPSFEDFDRSLGPDTPGSYEAFSAALGPRLFPDDFGGEIRSPAGRLRPSDMGLPGYYREAGEDWNRLGKTCSEVKRGKAAPAAKATNPRKRKCRKCRKWIKPRKGPGRPAKYHKHCRPK